jgi:hypothetical protein
MLVSDYWKAYQEDETRGDRMTFGQGDSPTVYKIQVMGELGQDWESWLSGMAVELVHSADLQPITTLTGAVADQAALRGLLCKLWDLNLTLISLRRIEGRTNEEASNG